MKSDQIAVSGVSASGKGTVCEAFARKQGIMYVDGGLVFRFGTYCLLNYNIIHLNQLAQRFIGGEWSFQWDGTIKWIQYGKKKLSQELLGPNITKMTAELSAKSKYFAVFKNLTELVLASYPKVIADGRSMGSVILPKAAHKFFMTADINIRAQRRQSDYKRQGHNISLQKVINELRKRDILDRHRKMDPLKIVDGATIIDTSRLSVGEVVNQMLFIVNSISETKT